MVGNEPLEEMAQFFENRLAGYEAHMKRTITGAAEFYEFTARQLPTVPGCAVLDLGCGTGLELDAYFAQNPTARITGIDLSAGMLAVLESKFPDRALELIQGSYFDVPLGHDRFYAAVSVESLHHFPAERKLALYQRVFHALKAGGYLILTDYFAESDAQEKAYFEDLRRLKQEQGICGEEFYHYDTPLTVAHELQVLESAGFSPCEILKNWDATYTLRAVKQG